MRTKSLVCIALASGLAMTVSYLSAQQLPGRPSVDAAKELYLRAVERAAERAQEFLQAGEDVPAIGQKELRDKLRPLVEESFAARQQLQRAELEELRRRLGEIEQAIQERDKNKDVIVNSRLDELLSGQSAGDGFIYVYERNSGKKVTRRRLKAEQIIPAPPGAAASPIKPTPIPGSAVQDPNAVLPQAGQTFLAAPSDSQSKWSREARAAATEEQAADGYLDIGTRERLAQIDLQEAEAKRDVANLEYTSHEEANKQARGSTPLSELRKLKALARVAEVGVERAKLKIEGLVRHRAELEAAADAAANEADAELKKAAANARAAKATYDVAEAHVAQAEADLEAAKAGHNYRGKAFARIKNLADAKSIDAKLFDEAQERLEAAQATLNGAQAAVATAKANVQQCMAACQEADAAKDLAALRADAAHAHRDRLIHRDAADNNVGTESGQPAKEDSTSEPTP